MKPAIAGDWQHNENGDHNDIREFVNDEHTQRKMWSTIDELQSMTEGRK